MIHLRNTQDLARRLLASETAPDKTSAPSESAAIRVCEKLRGPLCTLAGVAGYRALLSRALMLAREDAPWLSAMQVTADGHLQGPGEPGPQIDNDSTREGGVILLGRLLELFLTLVGGDITLRLLKDIAPHLEIATEPGPAMPSEALLQEVYQLNTMSKRLDSLAERHPFIEDALLSISGNILNTATILEVLVFIRNKSNDLPKNDLPKIAPPKQSKSYKM